MKKSFMLLLVLSVVVGLLVIPAISFAVPSGNGNGNAGGNGNHYGWGNGNQSGQSGVNGEPVPIPEPLTLSLLACGVASVAGYAALRKRKV